MGESPKSPTVDVEAPKFVAYVGTIVMMLEGLLYILNSNLGWANQVLYIITGIICIAGGVVLLLILNVGVKVDTPIPYKWWLLVAIGGGVITMALITNLVSIGSVFGTPWYLGGLIVGIAGLLEVGADEKFDGASNFVLFIGALIVIIIGVQNILVGLLFVPIVAFAVGVLLLLTIFDVIAKEWWLVLIFGATALLLVHNPGGSVVLLGWVMMIIDF